MTSPAHRKPDVTTPQASGADYLVVHIVVQESTKPLIETQVIDHMEWQATSSEANRPSGVMVAFIEPARVALRSEVRRHIRRLRIRSPHVTVMLVPYIGRLGRRRNAHLMTLLFRKWIGDRPVVFHCRNESAIEWAKAITSRIGRGAIVADIRGPRPDELLFAHGFDRPETADESAIGDYNAALGRIERALEGVGAITTVSPGMQDWLSRLGADARRVRYVPCCVTGVTFNAGERARTRQALGIDFGLVLAYLGVVAPYQHLERSVIPFVEEAMKRDPNVWFLGITPNQDALSNLVRKAGLPSSRCLVIQLPQREVASYLSAADAGLLLREPTRLTHVVQPVKLCEYLAAGVPVVVSQGAGVVDRLVAHSGAGVVTSFTGSDVSPLASEVERVLAAVRNNAVMMSRAALALCEDHFVWRRYTGTVREAYRHALGVPSAMGSRDGRS